MLPIAALSTPVQSAKSRLKQMILPRPEPGYFINPGAGPVVVAGMFQTANGIGRAAAGAYEALSREGFQPIAVDLSDMFNQVDVSSALVLRDPPLGPHGTLILYANAPETQRALYGLGLRRWHNWRIIGAWAWELQQVPPRWTDQTQFVSEIWAPSCFVEQAFCKGFNVPVRTVPHYITGQAAGTGAPAPAKRADRTLQVLTVADGRSSLFRKNILATVQIFETAFPDDEHVHLTVKCRNMGIDGTYQKAVLAMTDGDDRITIINRSVSDTEQLELIQNCDIFLSPHRSEGFGLNLAEAMIAGRAVIATGWSGNLDFMNRRNSVLLPYTLSDVHDPSGIYETLTGAQWAEVDITVGARALRDLRDCPERRKALGDAARRDIQERLTSSAYAHALNTPSLSAPNSGR